MIIGLDGASFNHIEPMLESGILPNFKKALDNGARADCISTIPPLTPPAWSTMLTGANPGKHGIFDFIQPDSSGIFRMVDAGKRLRKTFLDRARDEGVKVIDILVPYTFPPHQDTTGLSVSGLGTPSFESDFIRPHNFRDKLLEKFPFLTNTDPTVGQSLDTFHERLLENTLGTIELAKYSMEQITDWGLLFAVFQATDLVPHFYSRFFDKCHPDYDPNDPNVPVAYRKALERIYCAIDEFLGDCFENIGRSGGHIIFVSDHGSQPLVGSVATDAFLLKWLEKNGFLRTGGSGGDTGKKIAARAGSIANRTVYFLKRNTPHGLRNLANRILGRKKDSIASALTAIPFLRNIDWTKTKAFCAPGGYGTGIYINRKGDFPNGIVSKGAEYHKIRDEIKSGLESLEIKPGLRLFSHIIYREEALWGPAVGLAPDLLLLKKEDRALKEADYRLTDGSRLDPPGRKSSSKLIWCGTHKIEGMFAIYGEGVRKNIRLESGCNLADIFPTIGLVSGIEIPSDIDGRAISGAFTEEFLRSHEVKFGPEEDYKNKTDSHVSDEDSQKLLDLLTGLGYLN